MAEKAPSAMAQETGKARATTRQASAHAFGLPAKQGLYDPRNEHDACGVGFVAHMKGQKSHKIVRDGLFMLENLTHRGAVGADPLMGDGAGILVQIPDRFFREEMSSAGVTLPEAGRYTANCDLNDAFCVFFKKVLCRGPDLWRFACDSLWLLPRFLNDTTRFGLFPG